MGLIPGPRKTLHTKGQHSPCATTALSLWATATEACAPACALQQDKLQQREARAPYEDPAYRPIVLNTVSPEKI